MITSLADEARPIAPARSVDAGRPTYVGLALAVLLASLGTSSANVALPTLRAAFSVSFAAVQWVVLAYLLTITMLVLIAGVLGDRFGRRRVLISGLVLFASGSLLGGLSPSFGALVAARAIQGAGAAAMLTLAIAFVSAVVPKDRVGRAMGTVGVMSAAGTALGPSLGGWLIAALGWPAVFLVNVPVTLLALIVLRRSLPEDDLASQPMRGRFDGTGAVALGLTLLAACFAATGATPATVPLLLLSVIGAALFVRIETRSAAPLVPLGLLRDPALARGLIINVLVSIVMMATLVVGPFHLSRALGLEPAMIGMVMSVGPIVSALAGRPAGHLTDRFGATAMVGAGLAAMTAGAALLAAAPLALGPAGYLVPLVGLTIGYALLQSANNTSVMGSATAEQRGLISGLLNLTRYVGLLAGASLAATLFGLASGLAHDAAAGAEAIAHGTSLTFAAAAVATGSATMIAGFTNSRRGRNRASEPADRRQ